MPKLFTALDLPADIGAAFVAIQPQPAPGIRLVSSEQMHVTLHYIGEVDADRAERIAKALDAVQFSSLSLIIESVGQFVSPDGARTLWAGIRENAELRTLHRAVGQALVQAGISLEQRHYTPHVSLARCGADAPVEAIHNFLAHHQRPSLPAVPISQFGLYSSVYHDGVPVYRRERTYTMQ